MILDLLKSLNSAAYLTEILLIVLGLSTIINVLEFSGFMPLFISKWLNRNKLALTTQVLEDLGVDFKKEKRFQLLRKLPSFINRQESLEDSINSLINKNLKKGSFSVGKTQQIAVRDFADLMSGSCDPEDAVLIARCLSTHWANETQGAVNFDFVATPKNGSPFIGYEFAKIFNKSIVLHDCNEVKYRTDDVKYKKLNRIDSAFEIKSGMVALIVDDSTTGGRKVRELAEDLRELGCTVEHCLVAFAPQGKSAKSNLALNQVKLHSIVERN